MSDGSTTAAVSGFNLTAVSAMSDARKALLQAKEEVEYALYTLDHGPPMHATPAMRKAVAALTEAMCSAGSCAALAALELNEG